MLYEYNNYLIFVEPKTTGKNVQRNLFFSKPNNTARCALELRTSAVRGEPGRELDQTNVVRPAHFLFPFLLKPSLFIPEK